MSKLKLSVLNKNIPSVPEKIFAIHAEIKNQCTAIFKTGLLMMHGSIFELPIIDYFRFSFLRGLLAIFLLLPNSASAEVIIGPSPPIITSTVNVSTNSTTIVGSTVISTTGTVASTNVTGSILTLDSLAGILPGLITLQSINGNGLQANGGTVNSFNGNVLVLTQGGHAVLANGSSSTITLNGATLMTTGVGAGLASIGGTINATNVIINNTASSGSNISNGHGAIAQSGGKIILGSGSSITTAAFNSVGLGAAGIGSQVTLNSLVPITLNGRGAMGIYDYNGGQVSVLPGTTLQMNGASSIGVTVDNTMISLGTIGSGLTINLNGVPTPGQAASTGMVAVNGGSLAVQDVIVQGAGGAAGAWARPGSSISLSGHSVININAATNPIYYTLANGVLVTADGPVGSVFNVTGGLPIGALLSNAGLITSEGTTINVTSNNGVGAYAATPNNLSPALSIINMTDNNITSTGINSFGIEAASNGIINGLSSHVATSGGGAALFVNAFNGPAVINLATTSVQATGINTSGIASLNLSPDFNDIVNLTDSTLTSSEGTVVDASGGPLILNTNNSVLQAQAGLLIEAVANSFAPQQTSVQLNATNHSTLFGNALADVQSIININLNNNSQWTGAAFNVTNTDVDASSAWTVTENSTISQLLVNAGLVAFTPPFAGHFKTLTTTDYIGLNGILGLNTFLGGDDSPFRFAYY